jgi:hypothetical protein
MVYQEFRSFVRDYFESIINDSNRAKYLVAFNDYIVSLNDAALESIHALKELNILQSVQNRFIIVMTEKYGTQFSANARFTQEIRGLFSLKNNSESKGQKPTPLSDRLHALKLDGHVGLYKSILKRAPAEDKTLAKEKTLTKKGATTLRTSAFGFYESRKPDDDPDSPSASPAPSK